MAQSGLNTGMSKGIHQGVKSGLEMTNIRSGLKGGVVSSIWDKSKMQSPLNLSGIKKPLIYCTADSLTTNTGIVITLTDLVGSGYTLTNAQGTNPTPNLIVKDIFNYRDSLDFNNGASCMYPTPALNFSGKTELSVMMVCKLKNIASQIFFIQDSTLPGGVDLSTIDTNRTLRSIYYGGQPGAVTNSQYDSFLSTGESSDWMILTLKYRLKQPGGAGSEQEMYINGRLQHKFNSSNFNIITTSMTSAQTFIVGNTAISGGSRGNSMYLGSFLLLDYWMNESEQLRLENYFRWYYGNKF
jgi:hypothetical protein